MPSTATPARESIPQPLVHWAPQLITKAEQLEAHAADLRGLAELLTARTRADLEGYVQPAAETAYGRWCRRFASEIDPDPRDRYPCTDCGQTFGWRGYDDLCGYCYDERDPFPPDTRDEQAGS